MYKDILVPGIAENLAPSKVLLEVSNNTLLNGKPVLGPVLILPS